MTRTGVRDLSIVLGAALVLRVVAVVTLPLVITNDGAFYLLWGSEIAAGRWPDMPVYRTPGFPLWLAAALTLAGDSVHAVLCSQQALGVATAAACWWLGRWAFGPRVGLASGLLVGLDPWLLAIASFALSDMMSIALPLVALATVAGRPGIKRITFAGLLLGIAILSRPTAVAWVPGVFVLAVLAPTDQSRARWIRGCVLILACALLMTPWVVYNATRGVTGIASTEGLAMWGGLARSGRLDSTFPLPAALRVPAQPLFQHTPPEHAVMRFYNLAGDTPGIDRAQLLSAWSWTSIRNDPDGYIKAVGHAAAWQANAALPGTPYAYDPMRWMMRRLGDADAIPDMPANVSTRHLPVLTAEFADSAPTGPLAGMYRSWSFGMGQRFPQLPLAVLTLIAFATMFYRRRWHAAAVLGSSIPIVIGHAIILQPFSRYSLSAWMIWWIGGVAFIALLAELRSGPGRAQGQIKPGLLNHTRD